MLIGGKFEIDTSVTTSFTRYSETVTAYKCTCDKENRVDFWAAPYWYSSIDSNEVIDYHIYVYERNSATDLNKDWLNIGGIDKIELIEGDYDDDYTYRTLPGVSYIEEEKSVKYNPVSNKFIVTYRVESTEEETPILSKIHTSKPGYNGFDDDDTATTIPALEIFESACLSDGTNVPLEATYVFPTTGEVKIYYMLKEGVSVTPQRMFGQDGPGGDILPIVDVYIPETIKFLGGDAFTGANIKKLVIPDSIRGIASGQRICEPEDIEELVFGSGLQTILNWGNEDAYPNLKKLTLKNGIKVIGESAFRAAKNLKEVIIPDSVTDICMYAFEYGEFFEKIIIGSGVTNISEGAFYGCYIKRNNFINNSSLDAEANNYWGAILCDDIVNGNIAISGTNVIALLEKNVEEVVIPNGVTEIENGVFAWNNLRKLVLPQSLEILDAPSNGSVQFYGCDNLQEIVCYATTAPTIKSSTFGSMFYSMGRNGVLKYPAGSDYSSWLQTSNYYLGKYGWTGQEI